MVKAIFKEARDHTVAQIDHFKQLLQFPEMANPGEEIKTALQLRIFGRQEQAGTVYYIIKLWLVYSPKELSLPIKRRFNNFYDLHKNLQNQGFQNLPALPAKKLFMSEEAKEERQ